MTRARVGNLVVTLGITLLAMGMSRGSADAQTKLVKPANGNTLNINKAGSYFLAANYTSVLKMASIISVNVNNVTINLNGFTISGPTGSTATAINAAGDSGITIVNGTITSTGNAIVVGTGSTVGGVQLIKNNGDGIKCTSACLISNNVISGNTGVGLNFGADQTSGYQSNVMNGNGIDVTGGTNLGHNVCSGSLCPAAP